MKIIFDMAKISTFPALYNEALQINISKLKQWGYLEPGQIKSGTLNWSSNGNPTGSISISGNTHDEQPYIELDYKFRDEPRKYKIYFTSIRSNLNRGEIWYFICPQTKKRCRKLYSIGGYFLHRAAFRGCMYEIQTRSKYSKFLNKMLGCLDIDQYYEQIYKKHFKKSYAGKPTKKYLKITRQIQRAENISPRELERLLLR